MNIKERVKLLVEQTLNEVRIPTGYFIVTHSFILPSADKEWDINFIPNEIVHLDPANKVVRGYSPSNKQWKAKEISLVDLMQPNYYGIFKQNTKRLDPTEVKDKGAGYEDHIELRLQSVLFQRERLNLY